MGDLGSYSLDRFIPFMAESYFRLFERQNAALWPASVLLAALGIAAVVLALRAAGGRAALILLAAAFATVAIAFHFRLYAELTPVGQIFGWTFLVQSGLMLACGLSGQIDARPPESFGRVLSSRIGLTLAILGVAVYPLLAPLTGRGWRGTELFGTAPDPTVCVVLGIVLIVARPRWLWALLPIPLLSCIVSGATLHVIEAPFALALPVVGVAAIAGAFLKSSRSLEPNSPKAAEGRRG